MQESASVLNRGSKPGRLSFGERAEHISRLRVEEFDLAVIGGGVTGAGIALDASARGLNVALVDKGDFANGTSSRSTKLIHGGLRYLAQYEFKLTHEALTERAILSSLAPDLVEWMPFVLPMLDNVLSMGQLFAGLWLYDILALYRTPTIHRQLTPNDIIKMAPIIRRQGLLGGYVYSDCRTDDVRITLEVFRSAIERGAAVANYCEVVGIIKENGRAVGLRVIDHETNQEFVIRAKKIVAAGGVWVDRLLKLDDPNVKPRVRPAKGVHLVVPHERLPLEQAYFLSTAPDGRLIFVIPWQGMSLIGTTDTDYEGSLEEPFATAKDIDYLLESANNAFPEQKLTRADVISVQAGLRPLVSEGTGEGEADNISREDKVFETDSGMIAIAGGKLTTYRKMAQRVVDLALKRLADEDKKYSYVICPTDRIGLGAFAPGPMPESLDLPQSDGKSDEALVKHLRRGYGRNSRKVAAIARGNPALLEPVVEGLPYIQAEIVYVTRHEMARTLLDALARRLHVVQLNRDQGQAVAARVAELMGAELGWDAARKAQEIERFHEGTRQFSLEAALAKAD